jgi:hypothetical protein
MTNYFRENGFGDFSAIAVGDLICYNPSRHDHNQRLKVTKVTRVSHRQEKLHRVWCEDLSEWNGRGRRWGDGGALRTLHANRIVNLDKFNKMRADYDEERRRKENLDRLSANLRDWMPLNLDAFTDDELQNLRILIGSAKVRKAVAFIADTFAGWARWNR